MKVKMQKRNEEQDESHLYFSEEEQNIQSIKKQQRQVKPNMSVAKSVKKEQIKNQHIKSAQQSNKPPKISNNMQIKLQPSDIRFIDKIVEQKHGKILTREEMLSLKKKMVKETFNQSNPYTQLNYNTGQRNQWKDCMKKTLSQEDLRKLKKHFLQIMRMIDKGLENKYTLRDLARQFNLYESAFLQLKRQFSIDPDVSIYLQKSYISNQSTKQNFQIQHFAKKRYILQKVLSKNPLLTRDQLTAKISKFLKNNNFFPEQQISQLIQQEGYVLRPIVRTPQSRNNQQNLERRKNFCQKINTILTQTNYQVFFLGVMSFNSFMFRHQGWTKDEYLIEPNIDESFSLVAMTERSGQGTWKFQKQIYKEEVFGQVCSTLFINVLPETPEPKFIAVDIRLFKYKEAMLKSRKRYDVEIIWLPPFSQYLNPLQFWFQEISHSLQKSKKILSFSQDSDMSSQKKQSLIKDIYNNLRQVFTEKYSQNFDFNKYFEMSITYHQKAIKMEKF